MYVCGHGFVEAEKVERRKNRNEWESLILRYSPPPRITFPLPFRDCPYSSAPSDYRQPELSPPPHGVQLPNNSLLRVNEAINTILQARILAAVNRRAGDFPRDALCPAQVR